MELRPQEGPQTEFLRRLEDECLYGGAKGGGKSYALILESLRQVRKPGYRALILRRTYPRLQEIIDRSKDIFPKLGGSYSGTDHTWTFKTSGLDAKIRFGHCQNKGDERNYNGHEYAFIGFDQLEEFLESQYTFICAQNRSSTEGMRCYIRATANPGSIGHAWVKKRFIDNREPFKTYRQYFEINGIKVSRSSSFIPATVFDNKILLKNNPNYLAILSSLPERERKALLDGRWDVFAGQYFSEFDTTKHVVKPFTPPDDWRRFIAGDYGFSAPSAVGWFAISPDGDCYMYRELYETGMTYPVLAQNILKRTFGQPYDYCAFDPSIWNKSGQTGESGAEMMTNEGLYLQKGDNDRINGWGRLRDYLVGKDGQPHIFFTENCVNTIRTLPSLVHDDSRVEDVNSDGDDHCADMIRYAVMSRPRIPEKKEDNKFKGYTSQQKFFSQVEAQYAKEISGPAKTVHFDGSRDEPADSEYY